MSTSKNFSLVGDPGVVLANACNAELNSVSNGSVCIEVKSIGVWAGFWLASDVTSEFHKSPEPARVPNASVIVCAALTQIGLGLFCARASAAVWHRMASALALA